MNYKQLSKVLSIMLIGVGASFSWAADHREAPLIREDAAGDIADLYAFTSPENADNLVLAMTVNPFSVPAEAPTYTFSPFVDYRFLIDTSGDAKEEIRIRLAFSNPAEGAQTFTLNMGDRVVSGEVTMPTVAPAAETPLVTEVGGIKVFAGPRDDPFFFDVVGFQRVLGGSGGFEGVDDFAGFNTSAIVVEIPYALLTDDMEAPMQIWAETRRDRNMIEVREDGTISDKLQTKHSERMGNPAVNTALVPLAEKDAFNAGNPEDDAQDFAGTLVASLTGLGTSPDNIGVLASVAVPDTLKLVPAQQTTYPNGRALEDDVIDTLFFFIFNQAGVSDGVDGNDKAFALEFPYLADPHQPAL